MQFTSAALSLFVAVAAAQNSTASLPDLISQLPTCAIPCFQSAAKAAGCATTDVQCLCGTGKDTFISSAGGCLLGKCPESDLQSAANVATSICTDVSNNPDPSSLASASSAVSSALAAAGATSSPDSAATRPELGFGIMGAAAAAMLAL
ncbi:hypothetical protein F4861DRAFT_540655 [Xylaria intraflava]|nr:hypothetical protein F4861DRAFT_540655 [Xylaria intraflava]